jgi:hypothetical protein
VRAALPRASRLSAVLAIATTTHMLALCCGGSIEKLVFIIIGSYAVKEIRPRSEALKSRVLESCCSFIYEKVNRKASFKNVLWSALIDSKHGKTIKAYPNKPAALNAISAQAKGRNARSLSAFLSQRIRMRRKRLSQL